MKKVWFVGFLFTTCLGISAQNFKMQWAEEVKLKRAIDGMKMIYGDESAVYFLEGNVKWRTYYVVGGTVMTKYRLLKFDKNFRLVFEKEFDKELKGKDLQSLQYFNGFFYLLASDYDKKAKTFSLFGVKLDLNTLQSNGDMIQLTSWNVESKNQEFEFIFKPSHDGKSWMLIGDISGNLQTTFSLSLFDLNLNAREKTVIRTGLPENSFDLEDIIQMRDNRYLMIGREFTLTELQQKRKKTVRVFKKYILARYDRQGKKEIDLPIGPSEKFTTNAKLIPQPDGKFILSGFYANAADKENMKGIFSGILDPGTDQFLITSTQETSSFRITPPEMTETATPNKTDGNDKQSERDKRKADEAFKLYVFGKTFILKDVLKNPIGTGYLVIAESYMYTEGDATSNTYDFSAKSYRLTTFTNLHYVNGDILIVNLGQDGAIGKMTFVPKYQDQSIGYLANPPGAVSKFIFNPLELFSIYEDESYHSSYAPILHNGKLYLIFNDHPENAGVKAQADKMKRVFDFETSSAFLVEVDLATSELKRKLLFSNTGEPILMPKSSYIVNNEMYLQRIYVTKSGRIRYRPGKLTIK